MMQFGLITAADGSAASMTMLDAATREQLIAQLVLAAAGLRGSDFIRGWKRREDGLDIGLVDEASMLDERQFDDLREIFPTLVLFGDPAQLAPVGQSGEMVFDKLPSARRLELHRIHRQTEDNPILDLAHALGNHRKRLTYT